jgi:hypothetical protein
VTQFKRSGSIGLSIAAFTFSAALFTPTVWALPSGTYSAVITIYPPGDRPVQRNTCVRFSRGGVFSDATFSDDGTTRRQNGVWSATKLSAKRWQAVLFSGAFVSYNGSTPNRSTIKADGVAAGRSGSAISPFPLTLTGRRVSRCSTRARSLSEMFPNLQFLQNLTEAGPAGP